MSTKIYNGFIINLASPRDVFEEFQRLSTEVSQIAVAEYAEWFADSWTAELDRTAFRVRSGSVDESELSKLSYADKLAKRREALREIDNGWWTPEQDWDFSISFAPHTELKWLGIFYADKDSFRSLLFEQPWFQEYGYWNNTDQPDGITDEEWDLREKNWDKMLPSGVPINHMAEFKLFSNKRLVHPDRDILLQSAPSEESRIERLVFNAARDEYFKEIGGYQSTSDYLTKAQEFGKGFHKDGPYWSFDEKFRETAEDIVYSNSLEKMLKVNS